MTGIPLQDVQDRRAGAAAPAASADSTLSNPAPWFVNWARGGQDECAVNEWTALNYLAVYSCVSLIASTVAGLPLKVYRREGRANVAVDERSEARCLAVEFNPATAAMTGREATLGHLLTWGNSYTQVVRN